MSRVPLLILVVIDLILQPAPGLKVGALALATAVIVTSCHDMP